MSETNHSKHTYLDRMEALLSQQREVSTDIKELCTEMKSNGYDQIAIEGTKLKARWRLLESAKLATKHAIHQFAMNFGD